MGITSVLSALIRLETYTQFEALFVKNGCFLCFSKEFLLFYRQNQTKLYLGVFASEYEAKNWHRVSPYYLEPMFEVRKKTYFIFFKVTRTRHSCIWPHCSIFSSYFCTGKNFSINVIPVIKILWWRAIHFKKMKNLKNWKHNKSRKSTIFMQEVKIIIEWRRIYLKNVYDKHWGS